MVFKALGCTLRIQLEQLNFICKQLELGLGLAHLFTFVVVVFHFLFFPSLFSLLGSLLSSSTHFLSLLPSIITSFSTRGIIIELLNPSCKSLNETRNHHPPLFFFATTLHQPSLVIIHPSTTFTSSFHIVSSISPL